MVLFDSAAILEIQNEISLWVNESDFLEARKSTHEHKRVASLCARALLYKKLFTETGLKGWALKKDNRGKPFLINDYAKHVPYISLSHSPTMVAIAISYIGSIGIDIEDWKARDIQQIAKYAYGMNEIRELSNEGIPAFYRIWTVREAIAKMEGVGMLPLMNGQDVASNIMLGHQMIEGRNIIYSEIDLNHSLALVYKA